MKTTNSPGDALNGRIEAVIFDMDNTLHDLVGAKLAACDIVAGHLGRTDGPDLFNYFLRPDYGFEDWRNLRDYMVDREIFSASRYGEVCTLYEEEALAHIQAYEGVNEVVRELIDMKVPLGLVTDADMYHARRRLEKTGLSGAFGEIVTYEMTGRKKPDTAPFLLLLKKMGMRGERTAMIGDSPHRDIVPARSIGMPTFYARYGDRLASTRTDVETEYVLESIRELPGKLYPLLTA